LSQHINVFNQIIGDLKRVDVKFEDKDKALMLLNSLQTSPTYVTPPKSASTNLVESLAMTPFKSTCHQTCPSSNIRVNVLEGE
jgi:hypothetical protein